MSFLNQINEYTILQNKDRNFLDSLCGQLTVAVLVKKFTPSFQPKGEWYMRTQTPLKSIFGTAFIALLLSVVSCDAANPSALVGRWVLVEGPTKGNPELMEFLSDKTGIVDEVVVTWKTEDDRIYVIVSELGMALSYNYKLQGSVLTFTDNGKILKYTKCNKDCKESAKEYTTATLKTIEK